jgi:hypothetical protein
MTLTNIWHWQYLSLKEALVRGLQRFNKPIYTHEFITYTLTDTFGGWKVSICVIWLSSLQLSDFDRNIFGRHICMYVCIYIYIYICIYIYINIYRFWKVSVLSCFHRFGYQIPTEIFLDIVHAYVLYARPLFGIVYLATQKLGENLVKHVYVLYICIYTWACTCRYTYENTHTHRKAFVNTYIRVWTYTCTCEYKR